MSDIGLSWEARVHRDAERIKELEAKNKQQSEWLREEWGTPERVVGEGSTNRERAAKAEARVKELEEALQSRSHVDGNFIITEQHATVLAEREEQDRLIKRLQNENAEMRAHPMFAAPPPSVADRIVTSPEFRCFLEALRHAADRYSATHAHTEALVDLLDREVKR